MAKEYKLLLLACGFCLSTMMAHSGIAQTIGGSTSSGLFGQRSVGGGTISQGGGGTTFGTGGGLDQQANVGEVDSRFLRENVNAGQFVGSDVTEAGQFIGSAASGNQGGIQGFTNSGLTGGNLGALGNQFNQRNNRNQAGMGGGRGGANQSTFKARTVLRVGFDYQPLTGNKASTRVESNLSQIRIFNSTTPQSPRALNLPTGPIQVAIADRVATLRGEVASEADRQLAERLAKLEPGVSEVKNEITVRSAPTATVAPSPSPANSPTIGQPVIAPTGPSIAIPVE